MVKLNRKTIEEINAIDFASSYSQPYEDYEVINSLENFEEEITSMKWLNVCLEERGDFTAYLCVNFTNEFQEWNNLVYEVKREVLPKVEKKLNALIKRNILTKETTEVIMSNITSIIVLDAYREYMTSSFFDELLHIYKNGHIPCGWKGKYPKGEICIY